MKKLSVILFALLMSLAADAFNISGLKVEYASEPLGIDVEKPCFSWQMVSDEKGAAQTAYQITVRDETGVEVWNSGLVKSSESLGIKYSGKALKPRTRYTWSVTVKDQRKRSQTASSWFETGLMANKDADAAWKDARWIGGDASSLPFEPQYLPVFRISLALQLKHSQASLLYGVNDRRLMDANKNILGVAAQKDSSYIRLELNTTQLNQGGKATVNIYRAGYKADDQANKVLASFEIPESVINQQNRYAAHQLEISSNSGITEISVDGHKVAEGFNVNPIGRGGDYTAFPVVGDIGFATPEGMVATFSNVRIQNYRLPRHTLAQTADETVSGETKTIVLPRTGAPMLRTSFDCDKQVHKARIYLTARGTYDLMLNGKRVSEDYLNPGLTQYNKTLFYQTFDITQMLRQGQKNDFQIVLGEGWWSGGISFATENWNFWGDRQALLALAVITYEDGTESVITTQPETWQVCHDGAYRYGSIFQGEIYDARRETQEHKWKQASEIRLEDIISHEKQKSVMSWPASDDYSDFRLIAQVGQPVRENRILTAQTVSEVRPGVYVYDMQQNMPGVPRITFRNLKPGTEVNIRYAEVLYPELPEYQGKEGTMMLENIRAAMAQDIYIAKGGIETYQPRFTYHGYRYLELSGIENQLDTEDVEGVVLSTIDDITADYKSDNPLLNRFVENVKWSSLANIFSVPTDCPQRNERMGWSGDLSVFCPALTYIFGGGTNFLRRHLMALRDCQTSDGTYPAIAPVGGGFGGPLWESVGIIMPWNNFVQFGDKDALRVHYPSMKQYMDMAVSTYIDTSDHHFKAHEQWLDLGDWLGFEVNKNDNTLIFDCYLVYELELMSKMARALDLGEDASHWQSIRQERIDFICKHYFDSETGTTIGTGFGPGKQGPTGLIGSKPKGQAIDAQTSYVLPLVFGFLPKELKDKVVSRLLNTVQRQSIGDDGVTYPEYSLMTGFIGTPWITYALSENAHTAEAYRLLLNTQFPSWLYPVTQGATSIWERLNSMTLEKGFGGNNSMNSFNHYAFGSVFDWMMQRSLGICRDEQSPGFHHFILCPEPDTTGQLNEACGHFDSMYGRIESGWKVSDDKVEYNFIIPANTSATLILPGETKIKELKAGKYHFTTKF